MGTAWLWKENEGLEGSSDISSCYKIRMTFATPFRLSCLWIMRCSSWKRHFLQPTHPLKTTKVLCRKKLHIFSPRRVTHVNWSFIIVLSAGKNYFREILAHYFWSSSAVLWGGDLYRAQQPPSLSRSPPFPTETEQVAWQQSETQDTGGSRQETVELADFRRNSKRFISFFYLKICFVSFIYNQELILQSQLITGREKK